MAPRGHDLEHSINEGSKVSKEAVGNTVDEALEVAGVGVYTYRLCALTTFCLLSVAGEIFGTGLLVATGHCDLRMDNWQKGVVGSLPMLGIIASSHGWGYVADTRGRRYTLALNLAGAATFAFISSFSMHWTMLAVCKLLSTIFASGANAVMYTLLGESVPASRRSRCMLLTTSGVMLSQGFNAVLAYPILSIDFVLPLGIITYRPWRLLAQVFGLLCALGLWAVLGAMYESPKFLLSQGRSEDALNVLRKIYAANTGNRPDDYPVKALLVEKEKSAAKDKHAGLLRSMWAQTAPLLHKAHRRHTALVLCLSIVVYGVGPSFGMWFPDISDQYTRALQRPNGQYETICTMRRYNDPSLLVQTINQTDMQMLEVCDDSIQSKTLLVMMLFGAFMCVLSCVIVGVVAHVGKRRTCVALHLLCAGLSAALPHVTGTPALYLFYASFSSTVCIGIATAYAVELFPTYLRAMAVCMAMLAGRGASLVMINIIGAQLTSHLSCNLLFYGCAVYIFLGAVAAWFLPDDSKKDDSQDQP